MSHSCYPDIVPFVTTGFFKGGDMDDDNYLAERSLLEPMEGNHLVKASINGWDLFSANKQDLPGFPNLTTSIKYGKEGVIYCDTFWKKGEQVVYPHNSDKYCHVGGFNFCLMADSKDAITSFVAEVLSAVFPDYKPRIKANAVVEWWT